MAKLNPLKFEELLVNPAGKDQLLKAKRHHERLRLHVETADREQDCSPALGDLKQWVSKILPHRTYQRFETLMRFPLPTNQVSKKIFADLSRVFDGKNRVIKHVFRDEEVGKEFDAYKEKVFRDGEFWKEDVWESVKTGINNLIVVDVKPTGADAFIVPIEKVFLLDINRLNQCEYIGYEVNDFTRVLIDEDNYYTFELNTATHKWVLIKEAPHGLGEVPAHPVWSEFMHPSQSYIEKNGPISALLSDMDEIIFWDVANRHYQLFGAFPIYWEFVSPCTYEDERGNRCEAGYVTCTESTGQFTFVGDNNEEIFPEPQRTQRRCPVCEERSNIMAGAVVGVTAPQSKDDPNLREPMGLLPVDGKALDFGEERQNKRKADVIAAAVGINPDQPDKQAMNEQQVGSFFEDKQSILFEVKRNMELVHEWTLDIMARLMYPDEYQSTYVNYGDEFYLRSEKELVEQYGEKRSAGLPSYMLAEARQLLMETLHRTDPKKLSRIQIMQDLEPFPDYTVNELLATKNQWQEGVDTVALLVKMRFSEYIAKFERENISILEFGSSTSYEKKIDSIKDKLYSYAQQEQTKNITAADAEAKRQLAREPKPEPAGPAAGAGKKPSGKPNNNSTGKS